jgi:diacylglycerol kinase (ATP)
VAILIGKVLLVVNRAARRAPAVEGVVVEELQRRGVQFELRHSLRRGDAAAAVALGASGVDAVFVVGGDGTVMEVATALAGSPLPLGIVPAGTGNHVARYLRLPSEPRAAVQALLAGKSAVLDTGRIAAGPHFVIGAGVGLDAEIIAGTSEVTKRRWGALAYVATGIQVGFRLEPFELRARVDGVEFDGRVLMALVVNMGSLFGGLLELAPDARADDGWLDMVLVRAGPIRERLAVAQRLLVGRGGRSDSLLCLRGRHLWLDTSEPRPVQADGELVGVTPLTVTLEAGTVRFLRGN